MDALLLMIVAFVGYIAMYRLYGRYIGRKIFELTTGTQVPAKTYEDGVDFVPTKKEVIFGHHYTSIAGTGPIVGPAVAIIWGWIPAMIWIFVGSVVMGAVHDFGALIISMRNQGKSISDYTAKYINARTKFLFFIIVFLELLIVIAIFGLVIAVIFNIFPASVFPVWMEIPIAIALGYLVYKKGQSITGLSIVAIILMYVTVVMGVYMPIKMSAIGAIPATGVWSLILLAYAFIASVLPVTTLLQPRDFINSHQLIVAMVLLIGGVFVAAFTGQLEIVAPGVQMNPAQAPAMWPFLFITIACGAISGFHSLVSSGTSSKQVSDESDALFVGYGSMLMEGALATLVVIAVAAGIGMGYKTDGQILTGSSAWTTHYASWAAAKGLGSKIDAFVTGSANMISTLGLPMEWAVAVMGVFVASFAGTTLDTATRIQRYVVTELFADLKMPWFENRFVATFLAVFTAALLAFASGADGKGALALWPLFGAVNQTLAALALIVITMYLKTKGGMRWMVAGIPAVFMLVMTLWATILNEIQFISSGKTLLMIINSIVILIVIAIAFEGLIRFFRIGEEPAARPSVV
ncbi:carbon starvation protein A [Desulfonema ishimotonii]|uniref:Carbon starvation protein A n=1 Tax=Desulfonema ishimotonii TaxID=45657 RepID=A0A401G2C2_9BACT|nr:carbon starvation protein A [Desulfonema ishimotonii]GBC63356.1 carbon starvation protein A [Desulfonema ishimotonii]